MAQLMAAPYSYFADSSGLPLSGGKIYTYAAGTTTPKASYTDATATVPLANPVILDSAGRAEIWLVGAYKVVVKDSLDNVIHTTDNFTVLNATGDMNTSVYDPAAVNEQLVGLTASQTLTNKTLTSPIITGYQMGNYNPLINSDMSIAQRGTSFTGISGFATAVRTLDGWFAWADNTANGTVSQQSGVALQGFNNVLRVQRPNSETGTNTLRIAQIIETKDCYQFAGKICVLSFYARAGSNYSPTSSLMTVRVGQGTGADQGAAGWLAATWTGVSIPLSTTQAITTTLTRYSVLVSIASSTTEIVVEFGMTPTGTASTNDYFEITGIKFDPDRLSDYRFLPYAENFARCARLLPAYTADVTDISVGSTGQCISTTQAIFPWTWRVRPRVKPTGITVSNATHMAVTGSTSTRIASTAIAFNSANVDFGGQLLITVAAGLTAGNATTLYSNNSAASLFWTGAEL